MLTNLLGVAAVMALLITGLVVYGKRAKDQTPMMGGGCHGNCAECPSRCEEEKKK